MSNANAAGHATETPLQRFLSALVAEGRKLKGGTNGSVMAQCPSHADGTESLSITEADDGSGKVLLHCFAGCEPAAVVAALKLELSDLYPPRAAGDDGQSGKAEKLREHDYFIKDINGTIVARHVRIDRADGSKEMFWKGPNGEKGLGGRKVHDLPLYNTERLPEAPQSPVVICEGEKAADALIARGILALGTVTGAGGKVAKAPARKVFEVLRDRHVVLWPDDDDVGRQHMQMVAFHLKGIASSARMLDWRGPTPQCDAADYTGTPEDLAALLSGKDPVASGAVVTVAKPAGGTIVVGTDITGPADQGIAAIASAHPHLLFQRHGELVTVSPSPSWAPSIVAVKPARLREMLSTSADWVSISAMGESKPVMPPTVTVDTILARPSWPSVPYLEAVTEIPILRPDGSIRVEPGYDPTTRVAYHQPAGLPIVIPDAPTAEDVHASVESLIDLLVDFPFVDTAARAGAIASILTMVARHAIDGPVPMFHFGAPVRGAGKTLLATACAVAAVGRAPSMLTPSREDVELEKQVVSMGRNGTGVVLLDNIEGSFGSGVMAGVLTSPEAFTGRILGVSEMARMNLRIVWLSSGNNVTWTGDLGRRVIPVEQDPGTERPEDRTGFAHPDLRGYVTRMHPHFVTAALTILRAHAVAGRPRAGTTRMGSFEAWDQIVRGAVAWAFEADPCAGRLKLHEQDDQDHSDLSQFLSAWRAAWAPLGGYGTVAQSIDRAIGTMRALRDGNHIAPIDRDLCDALRVVCPTGEFNARSIGKWMGNRCGRIVRGLRIVRQNTRNVTTWAVEEVQEGGSTA